MEIFPKTKRKIGEPVSGRRHVASCENKSRETEMRERERERWSKRGWRKWIEIDWKSFPWGMARRWWRSITIQRNDGLFHSKAETRKKNSKPKTIVSFHFTFFFSRILYFFLFFVCFFLEGFGVSSHHRTIKNDKQQQKQNWIASWETFHHRLWGQKTMKNSV